MKTFNIVIEVDNNITLEDVEYGVRDMIDNQLVTAEGFYEIKEMDTVSK